MLKILVVDDEPKVRRGVSELITEKQSYELLGSCSSAAEAIDFLSKSIPDVIITDIQMPEIDGLELINHLKHRYHNLEFIILSGHGDFEYAKKALQYQVVDFLLKPLEEDELYKVLDAIAERRKKNNIQRTESAEENYLFNLIKIDEKEEEAKNLEGLDLHKETGSYWVVLLDVQYINAELLKRAGGIKQIIRESIGDIHKIYTCFDRQIVAIYKEEPEMNKMLEVVKRLDETYACKAFVGISLEAEDYKDLKARYFQALTAVKQYIYEKRNNIYFYDAKSMDKNVAFPTNQINKIMNAARASNISEMRVYLDSLLQYYKENGCSILKLKKQMLLLHNQIEEITEEFGLDAVYSKSIQIFISNIEEVKGFQEIAEVLKENMTFIAGEIQEITKQKVQSFHMNHIIKFVHENYTKDISLSDVAAHVNLSDGYLSNYFKTEAGMTFMEYITKLRIEKAKELLNHTSDKVYLIAEQVGYSNAQYFITLFKKRLGVTPAEYRRYL